MYFCFCDDIPKGQTFEAALECMKQYKFNDLEVSYHQTEDVKVDEIARNVYLYSKSYLEIDYVRSQVVSSMAPTGSFIDEQSVTIPNLLYNLITWVLTEDKSDRPISNLKVEMSEATNVRVLSFAQDIIYDVTRGKVKILKRVGLAVLLKSLPGAVQLVKVHQTLCRCRCKFGHSKRPPLWCGKCIMCCLRFSVN
jgi:hypothetical protein